MNDYTGIGNLTKDPTMNENGGTKFCNFTIAVNNRNGDASFINVSAINKQAEACMDHLQKGSQVCVKGTPDVDVWLNNDGEAKGCLKIKANDVQFLSRIKGKEQNMSNIDKAMQNTATEKPANTQNNYSQPSR